MKSDPGQPMTLGNAAAAPMRLIVWCRKYRIVVQEAAIRSEPDPAEMAARVRRRDRCFGQVSQVTRTLNQKSRSKQAGLIARAEFDFEEQDLSSHLGGQSYRFHLPLIKPRLDMLYGMSERRSSRSLPY